MPTRCSPENVEQHWIYSLTIEKGVYYTLLPWPPHPASFLRRLSLHDASSIRSAALHTSGSASMPMYLFQESLCHQLAMVARTSYVAPPPFLAIHKNPGVRRIIALSLIKHDIQDIQEARRCHEGPLHNILRHQHLPTDL